MKLSQILPSVRKEIEKPFEEKIARTKMLIKLWAHQNSVVSCSFGKDSMAVLWLCRQENPRIPVIFNNSGVEYPETLALKEELKIMWDLDLYETKPLMSFWQVMDHIREKKLVPTDGRKKSDLCCDQLKEIPFRRMVKIQGWQRSFTGLTAMESRVRMWMACQRGMEYYSKKDGLWKIHPIMFWTPEEVWAFTRSEHIPVNAAYQKYNIDRIGCVPCVSHREWRKQLSKTNPKAYKLIQERYFHQKLLEVSA